MKLPAAPFLGSDIGDSFGEVPAVTVKIQRVVLPLAIRMVLRFTQNSCTILSRTFTMTLGIFNPHLHMLRIVRNHRAFSDSEAALASAHLYAVIGDAKPHCEAKSF